MDPRTLGRPVGPLPPAVYWRRRATGMLAVGALLVLGAQSCGGGGAAEPDAVGAVSPTPAAARAAATPTTTSAAALTTTPAATPAAATECPAGSLRVEVTADAASYPAAARPRFSLHVTNTSSAPCRRDLGSAAQEIVVRSAGGRVWSSDDCQERKTVADTLLRPGERRSVTVQWSRRTSTPGCRSARSDVRPGTYAVSGRVGDVTSGAATFVLR